MRCRVHEQLEIAAAVLIDLKTKCFDMTSKVVHDIFPDTGGFKPFTLLGEAQRFTNQTPVHVTGGQVGAFHVSRVLAQQRRCEMDKLNERLRLLAHARTLKRISVIYSLMTEAGKELLP
jgi:hypothetical protein